MPGIATRMILLPAASTGPGDNSPAHSVPQMICGCGWLRRCGGESPVVLSAVSANETTLRGAGTTGSWRDSPSAATDRFDYAMGNCVVGSSSDLNYNNQCPSVQQRTSVVPWGTDTLDFRDPTPSSRSAERRRQRTARANELF